MLNFNQFFQNQDLILEEKSAQEKDRGNEKGVLHELLVGYHIGGRKHMKQHPNSVGETPQQVHDNIVKKLFKKHGTSDPDYKNIYHKAKDAAEHLRKHIGKDVKQVHWTSKDGDIGRVTGVHKDQKEDPSDIMIEHPVKDLVKDHRERFTGVSLKALLEKHGEAAVSSSTAKQIDVEPSKHWPAAREEFYKKHPEFRGASRKEVSNAIKKSKKGDRKLFNSENEIRTRALHKIAKDHAATFQKMSKQELANYARTLMRAHDTGHTHLRMTSGGIGADSVHRIVNPVTQHDHILNDPENISVRAEGHTVHFLHNGKSFFGHRVKANGGGGVRGGFGVIGNYTRK